MEERKNERNERLIFGGKEKEQSRQRTRRCMADWNGRNGTLERRNLIYVRMPEFRTLVDVDIQLLYFVYEAFPLRRVNRLYSSLILSDGNATL